MSHPFWRSVSSSIYDDLRRIVESGVQHVYIDTDRGPGRRRRGGRRRGARPSVEQEIVAALARRTTPCRGSRSARRSARPQAVHDQAHQVVRSMMGDGWARRCPRGRRAGRRGDHGPVLRNSGALMGLIGIKNKDDYTFPALGERVHPDDRLRALARAGW